jgi:hypothetical protein
MTGELAVPRRADALLAASLWTGNPRSRRRQHSAVAIVAPSCVQSRVGLEEQLCPRRGSKAMLPALMRCLMVQKETHVKSKFACPARK